MPSCRVLGGAQIDQTLQERNPVVRRFLSAGRSCGLDLCLFALVSSGGGEAGEDAHGEFLKEEAKTQ
jgi:hypothetical protein